MGDEAARKAERVKALLAGYYGAGEAAGQPGAAAGGGAAAPGPGGGGAAGGGGGAPVGGRPAIAPPMAMTLDSATFDANQHMAQMLKTSGLERLMVEHRNTAREIKNLDTDMQQLVTENYNKFITATDTVRTMKGEIDQAIPELSKLTTIMDNVSERSTTISTKLQARQDKMEELYRVQALLKKLQAVFDLPKRMKAALEEDVLDTAVSFYAEAQPLLKKYGNKGTFKHIAADSDLVAKDIAQVLKRRLAERKDDTEQCVLLLRKLGEPDDTLQDRYLAGRAQRLRRILKDATAVLEAMAAAAAAAGSKPGSAAQQQAAAASKAARAQLDQGGAGWGFGEDGAAPGLKGFVRALDEKLINAVQETVVNVMRFFMAKDLSPEMAAVKRKPLVALAREVFTDYFRIVRRALADGIAAAAAEASCLQAASEAGRDLDLSVSSPLLSMSTNWGTEVLTQALSTISADLGMVSGGLPELGLKDKAAALVAGAVQHHMDMCFAALRARVQGAVGAVMEKLAALQQPGGAAAAAAASGQGGADGGGGAGALLRKAYAYLVQLVGQGLESLMQGLRAYEQQQRLLSACYGDFMSGLQSSLQRWFLDLLSSFLAVSGVRYDGSDLLREALKGSSAAAPASSPTAAQAAAQAAVGLGGAGAGVGAAGAGAGDGEEVGEQLWQTSPQLSGGHMLPASGLLAFGRGGAAGGAGGGGTGDARTGLLLLLAKLSSYLEQSSVPAVMEALASLFAGRSLLASSRGAGGGGGGGNPDAPPAFIPGEVARRLSATSSTLLAAYVEAHGRQLSLMVRRSMAATSWLHHKEPRGPRPVCDLLSERLGRAEGEVVQLVEDSGRRTDVASVAPASSAARNERGFGASLLLETGNVERNLAKIFREKVKVFGAPVQFTQAAILGGIAGVGLKSLVECVRLQTLGRAGLQQLQLDCHYLRPILRRYTGGRTQQVVDSLLDEVVNAGVERSLDPTLLEPSVLDRILSTMDGN